MEIKLRAISQLLLRHMVDNEIKQKVLVMFPASIITCVSQQCLKLNTELPRDNQASKVRISIWTQIVFIGLFKNWPGSHSSRKRLTFLCLSRQHYTVMRVKSAFYYITKLTQPTFRRTNSVWTEPCVCRFTVSRVCWAFCVILVTHKNGDSIWAVIRRFYVPSVSSSRAAPVSLVVCCARLINQPSVN